VTWGAVTAAAVFVVHPLRVESVAWVTERRDVVSGLFFLLAALGYLKAVERGVGGRLEGRWRAVSLGLFVAALLSKASTMMLPAALLVLDIYPLRRWRVGFAALLREKVGYFVLAGVGAAVALVAVRQGATVTGVTWARSSFDSAAMTRPPHSSGKPQGSRPTLSVERSTSGCS
jgi:hypothetical protein